MLALMGAHGRGGVKINMNQAQQDLTRDPLSRQIFSCSLPLIFSNLLQVLFNMADVAVVGRYAGSAAE